MKFATIVVFLLLLVFTNQAQSQPVIRWQKCLGGSFIEKCHAVTYAGNDEFILAGYTESNDGQVSGNHQLFNADFWVVKIAGNGTIIWQKCLGGYFDEEAYSITATSDSGFIIAGYTNSNDGDVSGNHGGMDAWVVKLDGSGNIQWQKCLGGSLMEKAFSVIQTTDGGYAVAGLAYSNDGDVTGHYGNGDYWVVRLDSAGTLIWQKCLGGNANDRASSIIQTLDGGFAVVGEVYSFNNGDVTGSNGEFDCWVAKLDTAGALEWQRSLGGSVQDRGYCIAQNGNGDFIVGAYLGSYGVNLCSGGGDYDYWIIQLDSLGNLLNQHCHGGENAEYVNNMIRTNEGGYAFIGKTTSMDAEVPDSHGEGIEDFWLVITDSLGNLMHKKSLGGGSLDAGMGIAQADNNEFLVTGYTFSNDGDVKGSHGQFEYWVARLSLNYNSITGKSFVDSNSNSQLDAGEPPVQFFPVSELSSAEQAFTGASGDYRITVFDTGNFITSVVPAIFYNVLPATNNSNFTAINQVDSLNDFAFQPAGTYNDLRVTITPMTPFRQGLDALYRITCSNRGTTTLSPTIIFYPDDHLTFVSASVIPTSVTPDSIIWNLSPLAQFQTYIIQVQCHVIIPTPINTVIISPVLVEPVAGDDFPANNYNSWEVTAVGSFDPNDILVNRDTLYDFEMATPPYLEYLIRFQNTGNAPAIDVRVENNITDSLDLSTFEMISSSHNLDMIHEPHSRLMKFVFDNINLPDSSANYMGSNGFVRYRIKPLSSLVAGDEILNQAAIYFDFNEAVLTNTAVTEIVYPTSVNESLNENISWNLYPNPATHEIIVNFSSDQTNVVSVDLFNIYGQKVKTLYQGMKGKGNHQKIFDVSELVNGVYFVSIKNGFSRSIAKFIKLEN